MCHNHVPRWERCVTIMYLGGRDVSQAPLQGVRDVIHIACIYIILGGLKK